MRGRYISSRPATVAAGAVLVLLLACASPAAGAAATGRKLLQGPAVVGAAPLAVTSPGPNITAVPQIRDQKLAAAEERSAAIGERLANHPAAPRLAPVVADLAPTVVTRVEEHPHGPALIPVLHPFLDNHPRLERKAEAIETYAAYHNGN
eukprot:XP_001701314.1 predicted protein [Chlamydomonas reinhardtii]